MFFFYPTHPTFSPLCPRGFPLASSALRESPGAAVRNGTFFEALARSDAAPPALGRRAPERSVSCAASHFHSMLVLAVSFLRRQTRAVRPVERRAQLEHPVWCTRSRAGMRPGPPKIAPTSPAPAAESRSGERDSSPSPHAACAGARARRPGKGGARSTRACRAGPSTTSRRRCCPRRCSTTS